MDRSHIRNLEDNVKNTITVLFDELCKLVGRRAVASTESPALRAAETRARPKPREEPVINPI